MQYRSANRLGRSVSEIGYGMWGMADWAASDDAESEASLDEAVQRGVTFFDTAASYGNGHSERLLGRLLKRHPERDLFVATKVAPKNMRWPATSEYTVEDTFPEDHVRASVERSLAHLGVETIDLMQFHVWDDAWAHDPQLERTMRSITDEGLVRHWGISLNRWEPWNGLKAIATERFAAVQVVYNVFDQSPEDELLPRCDELGVAFIARVPFDEGALTGTLHPGSTFAATDPRRRYFADGNLEATLERVAKLQQDVPEGMLLPEFALRYILAHPYVTTAIPGMRRHAHVIANTGVSDGHALSADVLQTVRARHRWER